MDAGDWEEGERPLRPSFGVLWAEIHQPTKKSTPVEKEKVRSSSSSRGGTKTKVKTPTTLDRYARLG